MNKISFARSSNNSRFIEAKKIKNRFIYNTPTRHYDMGWEDSPDLLLMMSINPIIVTIILVV